jgi:hypothetical protein
MTAENRYRAGVHCRDRDPRAELRRMVEESRAAQKLPPRVEDSAYLARLAKKIAAAEERAEASR